MMGVESINIRQKKVETTNDELKELYMTDDEYKEVAELEVNEAQMTDEALDKYFWAKRPLIIEFYNEVEKRGIAISQSVFTEKGDSEIHNEWLRKSKTGSEWERMKYRQLLNDENMKKERHNRVKRTFMGLHVEYQVRNAFIEQINDVIVFRNPLVDLVEGVDLVVISIKTGKIYNIHVTSNSQKAMRYAKYKGKIKDRDFSKDVWLYYNPTSDSTESYLINRFPFIKADYIKSEFERWEKDDTIGEIFENSYLLHYLQDDKNWNCWDLSVCKNISEELRGKYEKSVDFFMSKRCLRVQNKKLIELKESKRPVA